MKLRGVEVNMETKPLNRNCKLEKSWIWPEQVTDLVKSLIIGKSINVCSGASALGDVKIDLEPIPELQTKNNIQIADMNKLPFEDNSFDTVISDPPWKLSFFKRMKPFFECVRICKVGGRIIYNCYWRPVSKYVELEQAYIRTDNSWSNVSVIWVFKKTKEIDSDSAPAKPDGAGSKNTGYGGHTVPSGLNREESETDKESETGGRLNSEVKL
jgi:hypothetical protein